MSLMASMRQNCGSTDLRLDRQLISWDIRGVEGLFEPKLLPVWKVESPPFETDSCRRRWHLELRQSKPDLLKCILVMENLEGGAASPLTNRKAGMEMVMNDSDMLNAAAEMEVLTGAVVNSVRILKTDGRQECFTDILAKHEDANGWKDWAQKFVEKRRKDGITEYIFGRDMDAYENAVPISYVMDNKDLYVGPDGVLHLCVELLFTSTVKVWSSNSHAPEGDVVFKKQVKRNNLNFVKKLAGHFKSKKYADLIIECHGRKIHVHKMLLEARLPKFYEVLMSRPHISKCGANSTPADPEKQEIDTTEAADPTSLPPIPGEETISCGQCGDVPKGAPPTCGETCLAPKHTAECFKEVVILEGMCPIILEHILHFAYSGKLPKNLDVLTLTQICKEAKKYACHELSYIGFLRMLNLFRDAPAENKLLVGEALKEVYKNADSLVFEQRNLSLEDLKKLHPTAFFYLGNDGPANPNSSKEKHD